MLVEFNGHASRSFFYIIDFRLLIAKILSIAKKHSPCCWWYSLPREEILKSIQECLKGTFMNSTNIFFPNSISYFTGYSLFYGNITSLREDFSESKKVKKKERISGAWVWSHWGLWESNHLVLFHLSYVKIPKKNDNIWTSHWISYQGF